MNASFNSETKIPFLQLALHCKHVVIESVDSWIDYHHAFVSLLFFRKLYKKQEAHLESQIPSLIVKGRKMGFGAYFYLKQGYGALIDSLFHDTKTPLEFDQLKTGAILYRYLPNPLQNAEMSLILLYLGLLWDDQPLIEKGLKCAQFSLSLYDPMGKLFEGVWIKEQEYPRTCESKVALLLFDLVSTLCPDSTPTKPMPILFKPHHQSKTQHQELFLTLFTQAFQKLSFPARVCPFLQTKIDSINPSIDRSLGAFRYQFADISMLCSLVGENTGVGSIHKKEIHIVSMGPHYAPLGDSNYYGIVRTSDETSSGLKDLKIELEEARGVLQGWTQMYDPKRATRKHWLFVNIEGNKEVIDLKVRVCDQAFSNPLFYVFFIAADQGVIGENQMFYPASLGQYRGKVDSVLFKKGNETMGIMSHFDGEMILIPLAGKKYFWSANFLLAFPLKRPLFPYHWTIH